MQIEVGVPLIVIGFLTPIFIYLIYRKVKADRIRKLLTQGTGEIFDKECERIGVVEEGRRIKVIIPQ